MVQKYLVRNMRNRDRESGRTRSEERASVHIIRNKVLFYTRIIFPLCQSVNSIHLWIILFLGSSGYLYTFSHSLFLSPYLYVDDG